MNRSYSLSTETTVFKSLKYFSRNVLETSDRYSIEAVQEDDYKI